MGNIDWKYLLFRFDGRINRAKYWAAFGATVVMGIVYGILGVIAVGLDSGALAAFVLLLAIPLYVMLIWIGIAVAIKRWHDRGKSGWWILIGLIPIVGPIWAFVETGILEGTNGPNEYGPDPIVR